MLSFSSIELLPGCPDNLIQSSLLSAPPKFTLKCFPKCHPQGPAPWPPLVSSCCSPSSGGFCLSHRRPRLVHQSRWLWLDWWPSQRLWEWAFWGAVTAVTALRAAAHLGSEDPRVQSLEETNVKGHLSSFLFPNLLFSTFWVHHALCGLRGFLS